MTKDDPIVHLATMLGIMAGDHYDSTPAPGPMNWEIHGFGTDELAAATQSSGGHNAPEAGTTGDWIGDTLKAVGAPDTPENRRAMDAWQRAEGPEGPGRFNWLNTTRNAPGATDINKAHVKKYSSYEQGLGETVAALTNGLYDNVIAALKRGTDARAVGQAVAGSRWGTGGLMLKVLGNG